jgi:hypothetical protein
MSAFWPSAMRWVRSISRLMMGLSRASFCFDLLYEGIVFGFFVGEDNVGMVYADAGLGGMVMTFKS